jgi:hypothetical protein
MSNQRDIEASPGDKSLQVEFLDCRSVLWERMAEEDRRVGQEEHARVRAIIRPKRLPGRVRSAPCSAVG